MTPELSQGKFGSCRYGDLSMTDQFIWGFHGDGGMNYMLFGSIIWEIWVISLAGLTEHAY